MVGANPHGCAVFFADFDQWRESVADAVQFFSVLCIGVFDELKFFFVGIIAGVHAHFFHNSSGNFSGIGGVVNIGYQWGVVARCPEFFLDVFEVAGFVLAGCGYAHVFTSCADHADGLGNRAIGIHGIGCGH